MSDGYFPVGTGRITRTPMEMSRLAAAARASTGLSMGGESKPLKPLTAKERLAQRKAEAEIRAQMPPLAQSSPSTSLGTGFTHYLRFGS